MAESRGRFWRHAATVALLVAGVAAVATVLAQSSNGKWWPGYSGPDNSRYFASRQIDRSNVNRLQVAWS